jgi:hypothetical protein
MHLRKRVLVTGGAGFLGSYLCERLLAKNGDHAPELPKELLEMELSAFDCRFILVINGHKLEWLAPLQEALSREFMATAKTWAFSPGCVVVLNREMAVHHHPILGKSATG